MEIWLLGFAFWVLCGVFAAMVASSKGRSGLGWGLLGFLFGPLALLAVGFMPATNTGSGRVPCPSCAELILPDAKVCRFCGATVQLRTTPIHPGFAGAGIKRCAKCRKASPPYATHCEFCGHDLAEDATPAAMG